VLFLPPHSIIIPDKPPCLFPSHPTALGFYLGRSSRRFFFVLYDTSPLFKNPFIPSFSPPPFPNAAWNTCFLCHRFEQALFSPLSPIFLYRPSSPAFFFPCPKKPGPGLKFHYLSFFFLPSFPPGTNSARFFCPLVFWFD